MRGLTVGVKVTVAGVRGGIGAAVTLLTPGIGWVGSEVTLIRVTGLVVGVSKRETAMEGLRGCSEEESAESLVKPWEGAMAVTALLSAASDLADKAVLGTGLVAGVATGRDLLEGVEGEVGVAG